MKCPFCDSDDTYVVETRETRDDVTRRRRECVKCKKRFTTYERVELSPLVVIKKNGVRATFDRQKVKMGILKSCEKRPVSLEDIDNITSEIDSLIKNKETTDIHSSYIGRMVMSRLKKLDKVSYIRFASVYKDFKDPEEFQEALDKLVKE